MCKILLITLYEWPYIAPHYQYIILFLQVKDSLSLVEVHLRQHYTKPPPRYSEGALVSTFYLLFVVMKHQLLHFLLSKKKKGFFPVQNIQLLHLFIFKALHVQVKKLEELGIGRPSTYASIMKVLQVIVLSWIFLNSLAYQRVIFVGIVA